jgi:hypothetical protein
MSRDSGAGSTVVFLVGPAHSGKTEVAAALRDQGETVVVRRAYFWRDEYGRSGPLTNEENLSRCLDRLERDEYLRSMGIGREDLDRCAELGDRTYGGLFRQVTAEAARRLTRSSDAPDRLVVQIGGLERLAVEVSGDLPGSQFIHTIRDPRRYFAEFSGGAGRLGWRLASWNSSAAFALSNSAEMPDRYLVVRGEDLIEEPGRVATSISSQVGAAVNLYGAGDSLVAKGRPLSKRKALIVERLVGHQLRALGYRVEDIGEVPAASGSALDAGMYRLRTQLGLRPGATT